MKKFIVLLFVMAGFLSCETATEESSDFGEAFHYNHPGYPYETDENNGLYGSLFIQDSADTTYWYSPTQQKIGLGSMGGSNNQGKWFLHNMDTYYSDVEHLQVQLYQNTEDTVYTAEFGYNTKYNNITEHIFQDDTNIITITGIKNVPRGGLVGMIKYVKTKTNTDGSKVVDDMYYDIYAGDWEDL